MEKGKDSRINEEIIDNFCVVDSWDEKQEEHPSYTSSDGLFKRQDELSKRKPTEDLTSNNITSYPRELSKRDNRSLHQRSSRSPLRNYQHSSDRFSPDFGKKQPSIKSGRNHTEIDMFRNERKDRERNEFRRTRRSRSRSGDKSHHRSRSPGRPYRHSVSPRPHLREHSGRDEMDSKWSHYRSSTGYRDNPLLTNPQYSNTMMSSNVGMPVPHGNRPESMQCPMPPNNSFGQFSGFDQLQNTMFNNSFQLPVSDNFSQNQHQLNYQVFNGGVPLLNNPPNPVPFPSPWNQSSQGFIPPSIPTGPVMYPHLKVGHSRTDNVNSKHFPGNGSPDHKRSRSSEKEKYSRSPESDRRKRHSSKKHSKSPLHQKYDLPSIQSGFESKKPKVIIDPNRIPTPPPPPIVGSYTNDCPKKGDISRAKASNKKSVENSLSDLLSKDKVSLSCLLEAVMENTGQGKSQLSDPKVKKEIISNCESKIRHLYKKRMAGLGAFIPDPLKPLCEIQHMSPLTLVCSNFTYNCEEEVDLWHCPGIVIPKVKTMKKKMFPNVESPVASQKIRELISGNEKPSVKPTGSSSSRLEILEGLENNSSHQPNIIGIYEKSHQNVFPTYQQEPLNWNQPAPQNSYPVGPMTGPPPEMPMYGAPFGQTGYPPFNLPSTPNFMPPHHDFPHQTELLNYPPRVNYPTVQSIPPAIYNVPLQPEPKMNMYQINVEENKSKKNYSNVYNNLIVLSNSSGPVSKKSDTRNVKRNEKCELNESRNESLEKQRRKRWLERQSKVNKHSSELQGDVFYDNLRYSEMKEDTKLDSIHDFQLTNLKERVESCLAEGKVSPGRRRSGDPRELDDKSREKLKDRERGRERDQDRARDRVRRRSVDNERKRHGRSPSFERKKYRHGDSHQDRDRRRSREPPHKNNNSNKLKEEISIISNEGQRKSEDKFNDCSNENEDPLVSSIFELLGPELRKIQEKSDLYMSIISSLMARDRSYKRLYSFKNDALIKIEKDNKMKMVVPRDNLIEIVTLIHKSFHIVPHEELGRMLKDLIYPPMTHIPKCISKVVSKCQTCIEFKKTEVKKEDISKDKKSDKLEKKVDKRLDKPTRERSRERKSSSDRDRKSSRERHSLALPKGRIDLRRKERGDLKYPSSNDGRPSGYEKATKIRKPDGSESQKSSLPASSNESEEKPKDGAAGDDLQVLHDLSDKALEFRHSLPPDLELATGSDSTKNSSNNDKNKGEANFAKTETTSISEEVKSEISGGRTPNSMEDLSKSEINEVSIQENKDVPNLEKEKAFDDSKSGLSKNKETSKSSEGKISCEDKSDIIENKDIPKLEKDGTYDMTNKDTLNEEKKKTTNETEVCTSVIRENCSDLEKEKMTIETKQTVMESKEASKLEKKDNVASNKLKEKIVQNKEMPKLDFKGRVRQVQLESANCRDILTALESEDKKSVDPSYLIKGGMLCKKITYENLTEVKIVAPLTDVEKVVDIVHTMSSLHTPPEKMMVFFLKHFTPVDGLESLVNDFVKTCSSCSAV